MTIESAIKKIRKFFFSHKRIPTYQEMCSLFGFASKKASFDLMKKLIKEGYLEKDSFGKLIPAHLFSQLPVLGHIKAGTPTDAEQHLLDTLSVEQYLVTNPENSYLLKVSGDSMIDAAIQDGDLVVVERTQSPREGDIVVAQVDNEWTLKYFQKKEGKVVLIPANKKYSPIYPKENLTIFGIVVSIFRKYH